ncbi:MAG: hypothetical protein ABI461_05370, partial [Polyangiaceae bacterium]
SLPICPLAIVVHLASVWVPFTSEAKEAVAHYDDLLKEMRLAIQECGRKLGSYLRARSKLDSEHKRLSIFQRYIPEVASALAGILGKDASAIAKAFQKTLPNFVNVAEANAPPQLPPGNGNSSPPPAPNEDAPVEDVVPKAKKKKGEAKVKAKSSKKKAEQLALQES